MSPAPAAPPPRPDPLAARAPGARPPCRRRRPRAPLASVAFGLVAAVAGPGCAGRGATAASLGAPTSHAPPPPARPPTSYAPPPAGAPVATRPTPPPAGGSPVEAGPTIGARARPPVAPPARDADGDGVDDAADACPTDPGPSYHRGCPFVDAFTYADAVEIRRGVTFARGEATPRAADAPVLDEVARAMLEHPAIAYVVVEGRAAPAEPDRDRLARRRAESVVAALVRRGVAPARLVPRAGPPGGAREAGVEFRVVAEPPPACAACGDAPR